MNKHILLTGPPGIGKTTVIKKTYVLFKSRNVEVDGFYTTELRDNYNCRVGFDIITLDNRRTKLARKMDCIENNEKTRFKVGQYIVYPNEVENVAVPIIHNNKNNLLIIDEIGKMELFCDSFKNAVEDVFNKFNRPILATIPIKKGQPIPLIESLRTHSNCKLINVDKHNRDKLPEIIIEHFALK